MKLALLAALVAALAAMVNGDGTCSCYEHARVDLYDDKKAQKVWPKALKKLNSEYTHQQVGFDCPDADGSDADGSDADGSGDGGRARRSGGDSDTSSLLDTAEYCEDGNLVSGEGSWMSEKGGGKCTEHRLEKLLGCNGEELDNNSAGCKAKNDAFAEVIEACQEHNNGNSHVSNIGKNFKVSNPKQCAHACSICACGGFKFEDDDECFPADAMVELSDGTAKPMAELVVGDAVRVGPAEFSEVFMFSHQNAEVQASFVKLTVGSAASTLRLTAGHYLYVNGGLQTARTVKVGDTVSTPTGAANVTAVAREWAPGLYNPHTLHGDIVVDGVLTSTYTESVVPAVAHALLFPARAAYRAGVAVGGKNWENGGGAWAAAAAKFGLRGDDRYPL